jgi:hypothetical protein
MQNHMTQRCMQFKDLLPRRVFARARDLLHEVLLQTSAPPHQKISKCVQGHNLRPCPTSRRKEKREVSKETPLDEGVKQVEEKNVGKCACR